MFPLAMLNESRYKHIEKTTAWFVPGSETVIARPGGSGSFAVGALTPKNRASEHQANQSIVFEALCITVSGEAQRVQNVTKAANSSIMPCKIRLQDEPRSLTLRTLCSPLVISHVARHLNKLDTYSYIGIMTT